MTMPAQANWKPLDRGIYIFAAMAICALVVAGFWPSYFSKLFSAQSQPLTVLVHVHGALMTAWIEARVDQFPQCLSTPGGSLGNI